MSCMLHKSFLVIMCNVDAIKIYSEIYTISNVQIPP